MMSNDHPALALATLSYSGPTARWRTEAMRSHNSARLIHITKGQGRVTVAGLTNGYGPNNLIYIPPHTMYGIEVAPTVFGQILTLPDTTGWPETPFHLRLLEVDRQKEIVSLFEAIERELQPHGDPRASICHFGLLSISVERLLADHAKAPVDARRNSAAAKLVSKYTRMIAQEFGANRSVASYAHELGVTPTHLTRCCRQTCGHSALSLMNDRIHFEACTLLRDTTISVKEIARRLGFSSPAYFTRSFQEKSGQPPRDFRRKEVTKPRNAGSAFAKPA